MTVDILETYTSNEAPKKVVERRGKSTMYYIPYDITENNGTYTCKYVPLLPDNYNYGGLVDAIIAVKFNLRDAIAILTNCLAEPKNTEYKNEFAELQKWRQFAKDEARKHFNM